MGTPGSAFEDGYERLPEGALPGAAGGPGPSGAIPPRSDDPDTGLAAREPYLRRVLEEFEGGRLEPYDYTQRVLAINAAVSAQEMSAIVERLPASSSIGGDPVTGRGLDAVDLALLRSQRPSGTRPQATRYVALAIVFVLFAMLIVMGMWLATRVHGAASPGAMVGGTVALVAPVLL